MSYINMLGVILRTSSYGPKTATALAKCRIGTAKSHAVRRQLIAEDAAAYNLPFMPRPCVHVLVWLAALGPMNAAKLAEVLDRKRPWGYESFHVGGGLNYLYWLFKEGWVWRTQQKGPNAVYHLAGKALETLSGTQPA